MTVVLDTFTLQIEADETADLSRLFGMAFHDALAEAEENLTLLLPDGYRAVIRRWDEGDEDE